MADPYSPTPDPYTSAMPMASPYASWIQRVGAYLIDGVPAVVIVFIGDITGKVAIALLFYLIAIVVGGYNRWYLGGQGQSWGKKALNIRLVSQETGQPIGTGMAFVRDICHFVDGLICYVGYLWPLWDDKRQTLADKIVKTVVIPA